MPPSSADRRKFARVHARFRVAYRNEAGATEEILAQEISRGGLFIPTPRPLPRGDEREYVLSFPGVSDLAVPGRVVEVIRGGGEDGSVSGMGIQFALADPGQQAALEAFIHALLGSRGVGSRKSPRIAASFTVRLARIAGGKADEEGVIVRDISAGGALLECHRAVALGDSVALKIVCPFCLSPDLEVRGEIRHVTEIARGIFRIGIAFGGMDPERTERFRHFLSSLTLAGRPPDPGGGA